MKLIDEDGYFVTDNLTYVTHYILGCTDNGDFNSTAHPFIRELVAMGCNTFTPEWDRLLVCGRAYSFDRALNGASRSYRSNGELWELKRHFPLAPHDFSAP